jgi:hypothetical protein
MSFLHTRDTDGSPDSADLSEHCPIVQLSDDDTEAFAEEDIILKYLHKLGPPSVSPDLLDTIFPMACGSRPSYPHVFFACQAIRLICQASDPFLIADSFPPSFLPCLLNAVGSENQDPVLHQILFKALYRLIKKNPETIRRFGPTLIYERFRDIYQYGLALSDADESLPEAFIGLDDLQALAFKILGRLILEYGPSIVAPTDLDDYFAKIVMSLMAVDRPPVHHAAALKLISKFLGKHSLYDSMVFTTSSMGAGICQLLQSPECRVVALALKCIKKLAIVADGVLSSAIATDPIFSQFCPPDDIPVLSVPFCQIWENVIYTIADWNPAGVFHATSENARAVLMARSASLVATVQAWLNADDFKLKMASARVLMALVNTRNEAILEQVFAIISRFEMLVRVIDAMGTCKSENAAKGAKAILALLERADAMAEMDGFLGELREAGLEERMVDIGAGAIPEVDRLHEAVHGS